MPILKRISRWLFLLFEKERKICEKIVLQFKIMTPSIEQEIKYLSGGNQQKVIMARWVNAAPKLIIMDEPTRGIDVGAKAEIYQIMRRMVQEGSSIIMISSELPEILGMSDRIIVMHEGEITGEMEASDATEEGILMLATGLINQGETGVAA